VEVLTGDGALDRLLSLSDYLVVTVPRTAETEGMIGARELARLPEPLARLEPGAGYPVTIAQPLHDLAAEADREISG
jgi:hypothetical protein